MSHQPNIATLRQALFDALAKARDTSKPIDEKRMRITCEIAARLTDTARAEIDFLRVTGQKVGSGFIPVSDPEQSVETQPNPIENRSTATGTQTVKTLPGGRIISHRLS